MRKYFVNRDIINEVGIKLEKISQTHGLFRSVFISQRKRSLKEEAQLHSYKIEDAEKNDQKSTNGSHLHRKELKIATRNLNEAFVWGSANFNPNNITPAFLKGIAAKIAVDVSKEAATSRYSEYVKNVDPSQFREYLRGIKGGAWKPPYASQIKEEMDNFVDELTRLTKERTLAAALEAAAYAHLHLIRIHPFFDGNGRVARTVQNVILDRNSLPPAIIYQGEKLDYVNRLSGAIQEWGARGGFSSDKPEYETRETSFYNYIAGKVSSSLDRIIGN